jgi:hypothetical protein
MVTNEREAEVIGSLLADIEEKVNDQSWNLFKLRAQYMLDCYEADVEPVPPAAPKEDRVSMQQLYGRQIGRARAQFMKRRMDGKRGQVDGADEAADRPTDGE